MVYQHETPRPNLETTSRIVSSKKISQFVRTSATYPAYKEHPCRIVFALISISNPFLRFPYEILHGLHV